MDWEYIKTKMASTRLATGLKVRECPEMEFFRNRSCIKRISTTIVKGLTRKVICINIYELKKIDI